MTFPDQLRFRPLSRFIRPLSPHQFTESGWRVTKTETKADPNRAVPLTTWMTLTHTDSKTRVEVSGAAIREVRTNPSVLHFGNHRGTIRDQAELDQAMGKVWSLLDSITERIEPTDRIQILYIEVGWNFPVDFSKIQPLLATCKHEWVRSGPTVIHGQSTRFHGKEFSWKLYDKTGVLVRMGEILPEPPQAKRRRQRFTRMEVTFSGTRLLRVLRDVGVPPETFPSYEHLKSMLRLAIENVHAPTVPITTGKCSHLAWLIVQLNALGIRPAGMHAFDFATAQMSVASRYRMRRLVETIKVQTGQFDIHALLGPAGTWPPAMEIAA